MTDHRFQIGVSEDGGGASGVVGGRLAKDQYARVVVDREGLLGVLVIERPVTEARVSEIQEPTWGRMDGC